MNFSPQRHNSDLVNENEVQEPLLCQRTDIYTIFINHNNKIRKVEVELSNNSTVFDAIQKTVNPTDFGARSLGKNDLVFFMSKKNGMPKTDFPAFELTQNIQQINFKRFVIVHKNFLLDKEERTEIDKDPNQTEEEEYEVYCWCFKRKKQR